jgi:hypothetical protein
MGISVQDVLGGTFLDAVKGIISQFHMSPEDKAKLQAQIEEQKDLFTERQNDYNVRLNDIAGQNIRTEEQEGSYTRNARPSVIWVGLAVIVWNYAAVPLLGHSKPFWGMTPVEFPSYFWEAWGVICTGYVFNRTVDKVMGMPGDSKISLPLGLGQISQSSPK